MALGLILDHGRYSRAVRKGPFVNSEYYLRELANVSVPLENAFQDAEYEARLANVRAGMAATDLDILLVTTPSNICYLTGYDAFGSRTLHVPASSPGR